MFPPRREGLKLDGKVVDQLVAGSQADIRQIINMLATYKLSAKTMDYDQSKQLFVYVSSLPLRLLLTSSILAERKATRRTRSKRRGPFTASSPVLNRSLPSRA